MSTPSWPLLDLVDAFDAGLFHQFYEQVLRPALPACELEEERTLEARVRGGASGSTSVVVAVSYQGRVAGGVVGDWYPASRCLLIPYLAVRADVRSQGLGSVLVRDVVLGRWRRRRPELVLAEIDDPRVATVGAGGEALARIRFFSRHSARLLRLPYLQPQVRPGGGRVRTLLVAFTDRSAVDGGLVRAFLEEYYVETEGQAATVPAALLDWTSSEGGVPVLPLERYEELPAASWE